MAKNQDDWSTRYGRLRWARKQKYESAAKAAQAMRVPETTYRGHENGSRGSQMDWQRYATFFGVSLDWLLTGRGSPRGRSKVEELYEELGPDARRKAIEYMEFLRSGRG